MTPDQVKAHWRLWAALVRATGWRMRDGRLELPESRLNLFSRRVIDMGRKLASVQSREPNIDDLRHGLYRLACGKESLHDIDPRWGFTRVKGWLLLCVNDANLGAAQLITDQDGDQRRRLVVGIRRLAPFEYIDSILRDACADYTPPNWERLPVAELIKLRITLSRRPVRSPKRMARPPAEVAMVTIDEPF